MSTPRFSDRADLYLAPDFESLPGHCNVYAWSDLHVDEPENMATIRALAAEGPENSAGDDILILAGDVSTNLMRFREALVLLKRRFPNIVFVPGNGEFRRFSKRDVPTNAELGTSLEKWERGYIPILDELGIHRKPIRFHDHLVIVPVLSWYTPYFLPVEETGYDGDDSFKKGWFEYRAVKFPDEIQADPCPHLIQMTDQDAIEIDSTRDVVITATHFLPREELFPRGVYIPTFEYNVGHPAIETYIRKLGSCVHVFGHTHRDSDDEFEGIRYVQNALMHVYEREASRRAFERPKVVYRLKLE